MAATNLRNHAWVLAGLGEKAEGLRFLDPLVALDREYRLGFDACEGMALARLGHWLSA